MFLLFFLSSEPIANRADACVCARSPCRYYELARRINFTIFSFISPVPRLAFIAFYWRNIFAFFSPTACMYPRTCTRRYSDVTPDRALETEDFQSIWKCIARYDILRLIISSKSFNFYILGVCWFKLVTSSSSWLPSRGKSMRLINKSSDSMMVCEKTEMRLGKPSWWPPKTKKKSQTAMLR